MSWRYASASRLDGSSSFPSSRLPTSATSASALLSACSEQQITGRHLQRILHHAITPCRAFQRQVRCENIPYDVDCDKVYPGIYIGNAASAKNKTYVRMKGFTHILNAAEGSRYGQVDTGPGYYYDMPNIQYMGLNMIDAPTTNISLYFSIAARFIDSAVSSGGKVLVHCLVGMSRSATCVLAYLMMYRKMSAADAIRTVRLCRDIRPNDGFLQQLAELEMSLKRQHVYSY